MIFANEKSMQSTLWLAKIERVEQFGEEGDLLRLTLADSYGRYTETILDEDAAIRHLERATGPFEDPTEIVGKMVIVVFDRLGEITAFYKPDENDLYEIGVGPAFNPQPLGPLPPAA